MSRRPASRRPNLGGARVCAERQISIRHSSLAHQPAVHDLPLVLTSWSKIQKRGSRLLQLKKEFKRIAGARCLGIDGLRLDPSVPLPDNQRLCVLLSHSTHARSNGELSTCEDGNVRANDYEMVFRHEENGLAPVTGRSSARSPPDFAGASFRLRSGLTPIVRTAGPSP